LKDLHFINDAIRDFIEDDIMLSMPFPNMSKMQRFQISRLASFYGIKTKNVGSGKRCFAELNKTHKTRMMLQEDVTNFMEDIFVDVKIEELDSKKNSPKRNASPKKNSSPKNGGNSGNLFFVDLF
jgi:hypothetical protein